ncbi:MAG: OmpA family protein [Verrucomicrobiales bacterium]|jgi:peptidoglycan-associated lipoprotein|nr:OmpA family protein [Verrucomicrobiales bacterium]
MQKYIHLIAAALTITLTACSNSHRGIDETGGGAVADWGGGTLPLDAGVPLSRADGVSPDDADYNELRSYTVHFDYDSFTIKASERPKLEYIARWLAENPGVKLVVAGHTDSRGTIQYNVALGERRALATRDYLLGLGANSAVLTTVSYGKERPAQQGENESAWAANRRAVFGVAR